MNHMDQLKNIRAEAISRLRASEDYKLAIKLGELIMEMGDTIDEPVSLMGGASKPASSPATVGPSVVSVAKPFPSGTKHDTDNSAEAKSDNEDGIDTNEMIDSLVSEMENDGLLSSSSKDPFSAARDAKPVNGAA